MSPIPSPTPSVADASPLPEAARTASTATPADRGPAVTPRYQVSETSEAYHLVIDLPGVAKGDLDLDVDHEQLRVVGRRGWRRPEAWAPLRREIPEASFELVLDHDRAIDAAKAQAELREGVFRVVLPKAESLKPRKIAVA